jgi:hypothetical protein
MSKGNGRPASAVQRLYQARQLADRGIAPNDEEFAKLHPNLWELLTVCWLDADQRIDPAYLRVSACAGDWVHQLSSPAMKGSLSVATRTFAEGLNALEVALATGSVAWSFWLKQKPAIRKQSRPDKGT